MKKPAFIHMNDRADHKFTLYAFYTPLLSTPFQANPLYAHHVSASLDKTIEDFMESLKTHTTKHLQAIGQKAFDVSLYPSQRRVSCIQIRKTVEQGPEALEELAEELAPVGTIREALGLEEHKASGNTRIASSQERCHPLETTPPPIELYHPAFAQFAALAHARVDDPESEDISRDTARLIRSCSQIEMQEGLRNTKTLEILERILGVSFEQVTDDDRSAVNYMGVHTTPLGSVAASLVIAEVKAE
ncbi:hypothetical protein PM082_016416 [Marasmius tenuissimus]|nr:hypothetical protein PM082_016416 [Marasmius tenuissimus]